MIAARSFAFVEARSVCRVAIALSEFRPVRAATWLAREATMDFRDGEGSAMDALESSTHWSTSEAGGEMFALRRLEGEEARSRGERETIPVFLVK